MFVRVKKVAIRINNGKCVRDWVLGVLKRRYGKQFDSTPLGEDKITIKPKPAGKELFFAHERGISGMVPIFKAGEEGKNFGLSGYCEETGEQLNVSVDEVINA